MEKKEKKLIYEPVAGLTIPEAFARAILMSKKEGKPVHAIINDVEMDITSKTNLNHAVTTFRKKLQKQYEAECRAYELRHKKQNQGR